MTVINKKPKPQSLDAEKISIIEEMAELYPGFLDTQTADGFFAALYDLLQWQQEYLTIFGKTHQVRRLIAWYGDSGLNYRYSGVDHFALEWTDKLIDLKRLVEQQTRHQFNGVLLNLYRDGDDRMGWHSDDEKSLGSSPVIASLSLGAERRFSFRQKQDHAIKCHTNLPHGSLLVMQGNCQQLWQHQLPVTRKFVAPRINLTFRNVKVPCASG